MRTDNPATVGTLVAMIALQEQLLWPFEQLLEIGRDTRKTRALFTRIFEYLDTPVEITERAQPVVTPRAAMRGAVQLDHVRFAYADADRLAVDDISLTIPAGKPCCDCRPQPGRARRRSAICWLGSTMWTAASIPV